MSRGALGLWGALSTFAFIGPFLHQNNIQSYILQLCWYKDECANIVYPNIVLSLNAYFFLLILKYIKTSSGPLQCTGPRH